MRYLSKLNLNDRNKIFKLKNVKIYIFNKFINYYQQLLLLCLALFELHLLLLLQLIYHYYIIHLKIRHSHIVILLHGVNHFQIYLNNIYHQKMLFFQTHEPYYFPNYLRKLVHFQIQVYLYHV